MSGRAPMTVIVTKRGVVTLPKEFLQHIGVQSGEKIELILLPGGRIGVNAARPKGGIEEL